MRSILVGPSGSGKTVHLTNMVLDIYKARFHEFIFGVHRLKLTQHGNLLRIISETILSQMIEKHLILIHTIHQNLNKLLKHNKHVYYQKRKT